MELIIIEINRELIKQYYSGVKITDESVKALLEDKNVLGTSTVADQLQLADSYGVNPCEHFYRAEGMFTIQVINISLGKHSTVLKLHPHHGGNFELKNRLRDLNTKHYISFRSLFKGLNGISPKDYWYGATSGPEEFLEQRMTDFEMHSVLTNCLATQDFSHHKIAEIIGLERLSKFELCYEDNRQGDVHILAIDLFDQPRFSIHWNNTIKQATLKDFRFDATKEHVFTSLEDYEAWFKTKVIVVTSDKDEVTKVTPTLTK